MNDAVEIVLGHIMMKSGLRNVTITWPIKGTREGGTVRKTPAMIEQGLGGMVKRQNLLTSTNFTDRLCSEEEQKLEVVTLFVELLYDHYMKVNAIRTVE